MFRHRVVLALGLIALAACASAPALAQRQGRSAEPRPGRGPVGPYVIQSEEEARHQLGAEEQRRESEQAADRFVRMEGRPASLLLFPYVFNIIVLLPVGLMTLFGGAETQRRLFQGKYPDSPGLRTILGSMWTAIFICSAIGLFYPFSMSPLLLLQLIYKTLWWLVFVLPRLLSGRAEQVHWPIAGIFLFILLTYPWVIPWAAVFAR
jgi:hypothetical protein